MSDTSDAMREFRFLDEKRKMGTFSPHEQQRWYDLRHILGMGDPPPPAYYPVLGYYAEDGNWYPYPPGYAGPGYPPPIYQYPQLVDPTQVAPNAVDGYEAQPAYEAYDSIQYPGYSVDADAAGEMQGGYAFPEEAVQEQGGDFQTESAEQPSAESVDVDLSVSGPHPVIDFDSERVDFLSAEPPQAALSEQPLPAQPFNFSDEPAPESPNTLEAPTEQSLLAEPFDFSENVTPASPSTLEMAPAEQSFLADPTQSSTAFDAFQVPEPSLPPDTFPEEAPAPASQSAFEPNMGSPEEVDSSDVLEVDGTDVALVAQAEVVPWNEEPSVPEAAATLELGGTPEESVPLAQNNEFVSYRPTHSGMDEAVSAELNGSPEAAPTVIHGETLAQMATAPDWTQAEQVSLEETDSRPAPLAPETEIEALPEIETSLEDEVRDAPEAEPPEQPINRAVFDDAKAPLTSSFVDGEHRVIIHTVEGQVKRGLVRNLDLVEEVIPLEQQSGFAPEKIPANRIKAIFFMLPPGGQLPTPHGEKVRVTFTDGRQVAGFSEDHQSNEAGFFVIPADNRTNTARIYIFRSSVQAVAQG